MNKDKQLKAILPSGFQDTWGDALALKKKLLKVIEKISLNMDLVLWRQVLWN